MLKIKFVIGVVQLQVFKGIQVSSRVIKGTNELS
ncbi:hypothetical protein Pse7367_1076 [Thalassoporum mexicanum PCC 7367]|nr:hypothetical protein Pse7367_1076 [Pseudanabaena sp. PCC 7367]